ncbi:MAG TPA: calcium-binding protein [Caulobacteraceae bacterium]|jgi:Ca2+-binding RTX toxin-like protein
MRITGTAGDDLRTGTAGRERFFVDQGGDDSVSGLDGDDNFYFGAAFTADDTVAGGEGHDHLRLEGDYSAGVVFGAATVTGIERLLLGGTFNYSLTINDATVAAGDRLNVRFTPGSGGYLVFDGSAETDGRLLVRGGNSGDNLTGGARGDQFDLSLGGADNVHGGAGRDRFILGATFGDDVIDGGAGWDRVELDGAYAKLAITGAMMSRVESLSVAGGNGAIGLDIADDVVKAGRVLTVAASQLGAAESLIFDGLSETDGAFNVTSGAGADYLGGGFSGGGRDTLIGGGGDDTIEGWSGADDITGGTGTDVFFYKGVEFSTGIDHDTIRDVNFDEDRFFLETPTGIDTAVTGADISEGTFDSDLAAAVSGHLGTRHAIIVTASSGDLSGHSFLVVDVGERPTSPAQAAVEASYDAGYDYVFDITGYSGVFDLSDFS